MPPVSEHPPARAGVQQREIDESRAGQRLDNYLLGQLKGVPRTHVYRLLRTGQVRVNGARARAGYRLAAGDRVRIPPVRTAPGGSAPPDPERARDLLRRVLHEDDELLVLDKPAGLAVHGGSGVASGLVEILKDAGAGYGGVELAHRLDKETSGCLVLAKSRPALLRLHEALRTGRVDKRYLALVAGAWPGDATVRLALAREGGARAKVVASDGGKAAVSHFRVRERFPGATLLEVRLDTGRMHQIRVHAAASGHAVAGDARYGDHGFNRSLRPTGLRRMFLHAAAIGLPDFGGLRVRAPLPGDLQAVLDALAASCAAPRGK